MFIGRKTELANIIDKLESPRSEAILIYGRRRLGKTFLINEALKSFHERIFHFTFRDVSTETNIKEFGESIGSFLGKPGIKFDNLGVALDFLFSSEGPLTVFLDEYSFLRRDDSGIDSYFQIAYDNYRYKRQIKLIICGSYMDIMEKMIEHTSPMYGRFSLIMQLHPFDYYDSSCFASGKSDEEKFEYYALFGGSGFTLSNIDYSLSPEKNLERLFIQSDSLFEREINSILDQEVRKPENAKEVLESIALGCHKFVDINHAFTLKNGGQNVAYLLKKLLDMDLIVKVGYINKTDEKNSSYFIKDNLMDFYYSYLFKATDARANMSPGSFYKSIENDVLTSYLPRKFESASKEFLVRMNKRGLINPPFASISRYFYNDKEKKLNGEFDLVAKSKDSLIDYECKYHDEKVGLKDYEEELRQITKLSIPFTEVGFISKNGVKDDFPKDKICYCLSDFYSESLN